jgi:hypothetical protein
VYLEFRLAFGESSELLIFLTFSNILIFDFEVPKGFEFVKAKSIHATLY